MRPRTGRRWTQPVPLGGSRMPVGKRGSTKRSTPLPARRSAIASPLAGVGTPAADEVRHRPRGDLLGDYAPIMRAKLMFVSYTLLRPCEPRALDWHGIDLDAGKTGRATIPETKSNRPKTVTLIPTARAALEDLLRCPAITPPGRVPQQHRRQVDRADDVGLLKEVRARAGVTSSSTSRPSTTAAGT